ncbi:uncharacterized protein F5891DRAFT_1063703 [Suillus fuscotomentosus]|uniref:Uncharacterized protein n=1 Tax=Suillus fuscotomentosus TaxID=1912939 RepID=A0AAD4HFA2_9AGAM|nr:uncharacterized protein F5891DRAFT_1063703 [Suillus fuscotomentosus]KAG1894056.1 hypothetical protein F5891DRAFT_1063703 [Suillus fuscotomentosus]
MGPKATPAQKTNTVVPYSAILRTSLAYSRTFNPRNLEYHWYPLWDYALSNLVRKTPNLIVFPQFPLWFIPSDDDGEVEEAEDGDNLEEMDAVEPHQAPAPISPADDDDFIDEGVSLASTTAEPKARGVLVDFAIISVKAGKESQHKERYGGWRITGVDVGLLVEIKRSASRSLKGKAFERALSERLGEAIHDLFDQAVCLFLENPTKHSVMAMAVAGPYWCNTTITRAAVKNAMERRSTKDPSYSKKKNSIPSLRWSSTVRLYSALSDQRLQNIRGILANMGGS